MINKTDVYHCGQLTVWCKIKFNDGGKRYGVVRRCRVCGQNSQMTGGGNFNIIKPEHLVLPWLEDLTWS